MIDRGKEHTLKFQVAFGVNAKEQSTLFLPFKDINETLRGGKPMNQINR